MSINSETEVNDIDSIDLEHSMSAPHSLQALPAELIGMLAEILDDEDLPAMRATCRELCDGTAFEFC